MALEMALEMELDRGGRSAELVVVLHGFAGSPDEMQDVRNGVRAARPDADIYTPRLPFAGPIGHLCTRSAEGIAAALVEAIDTLWTAPAQSGEGRYQRTTLVGHSFGSVLVRKIAVLAHGETPDVPFGPALQDFRKARAWANAIERIVLLAGMTGGWSVTSAMDWIRTVWWSIASFVGDTIFNGRLTIFSLRKGAPFLVQTRLQWLALMRRNERPNIVVVQLLGTIDDLVSPDDTIDYAVDLDADRRFFLLEVPKTGHYEAITMKPPASSDGSRDQNESAEAHRWSQFCHALCDTVVQLEAVAIPRDQMADSLPPPPNPNVTDVVFVIHGIRDKGYWTQKIARTIKKVAAGRHHDFRSVTTSYGYFAMAPFVFPWVRRRKVEWLMDRYTETRAHYPKADFSYVGHSNGTYLVARALRDYPAARFKRIVLAGSVVRCDYDWQSLIRPHAPPADGKPRVEAVLNYVATRDWVVALFSKGMQPFRAFDLGSAGHDGFAQGTKQGPIYQVEFIRGSHGAGHEERHWHDIAGFIVDGNVPAADSPVQSPLWRELGHWSSLILGAIVLAILGIGGMLVASIFSGIPCWQDRCVPLLSTPPTAITAAIRSFASVVYVWIVYIVVTRV